MADRWIMRAAEGGYYNGQFFADGWGTKGVKVISVKHGISIFSSEDATRFAKVVYPFKVTEADFTVNVVFSKHASAEAFSDLIMSYAKMASDPDAPIGAMGVVVPSRNFTRYGVPISGMVYGDEVGRITHPMSITFTAASDPLSILQEQDLSRVADITETNSIYYPADVGQAADYALYRKPRDPNGGGIIPIKGPR